MHADHDAIDNNHHDFNRYICSISTECLGVGECVKLHKTLDNSGSLVPVSQSLSLLFYLPASKLRICV